MMTQSANPERVSSGDLELTALIATAYVAHNYLAIKELPGLIASIHSVLRALDHRSAAAVAHERDVDRPSAAKIRRSVTDEALISFVDGRPYKTLKRHLTAHGFTPERYRSVYGLPDDYPMVAPSYAAKRSAVARAIGLGVPGAMAKLQAAQ
jgi:predicted transcriptional regulator